MHHTSFLLGNDNKNEPRVFPAWPCNKEFYFFQKLFKFFQYSVSNFISVIHVLDFLVLILLYYFLHSNNIHV